MSVQSEIVTALAAVAGGRVFPQAATADAVKPFVIYKNNGSEPVMTINGYAGITRTSFTFDCWGATAQSALDTAASLRTALEISSFKWVREPTPDNGYDSESDEYVEPVVYSFWHV